MNALPRTWESLLLHSMQRNKRADGTLCRLSVMQIDLSGHTERYSLLILKRF